MFKTFFITIILFCISNSNISYAQCTPKGGNQEGCQGCGGGDTNRQPPTKKDSSEVITPHDPNLIVGLDGYEIKKWVSLKDRLNYTIFYENDPKAATAPAQNVLVRMNLPPGMDISGFKLAEFGFGSHIFQVPANVSYYNARLDLRDSLGLYVDVIAGYDAVKNQLFWFLKSIDPATGRTPTDALKGFLPVNDSIKTEGVLGKGEGFVRFSIRSQNSLTTGDTVSAQASIIFDSNDSIPTNTWVNTIDALAPASSVHGYAVSGSAIKLNFSGQDDPGGTGVKTYAVYVAENNGAFVRYSDQITDTNFTFTGTPGNKYDFFSLATDQVGNEETLKKTAEITVTLTPCHAEVCNGIDDDCDGLVDEEFTHTYYKDNDGDGYGDESNKVTATDCNHPAGFVLQGGDCDDNDPNVHPGAVEICGNGKDDNCDGQIDEGCIVLHTYYRDADNDGYGNPSQSISAATQPTGYVTNNTDCDDADATIYPGAPEVCDNKDNNCNGSIDEGIIKNTYYRDADGDGFGDAGNSIQACTQPTGYVTNNSDCNDNNTAIHAVVTYYRDNDGDGFGNPLVTTTACSTIPPAGYVANSSDCDDSNAALNPNTTWYLDADGDSYFTGAGITSCSSPGTGYRYTGLLGGNDCNDGNASIHQPITYYRDADGDGFGDPTISSTLCSSTAPAGYVLNNTDCNDASALINPDTIWYLDADNDGYYVGSGIISCTSPGAGYRYNNLIAAGDCNDNNAAIHNSITYFQDADGDGFGNASVSTSVCSNTPPAGYVASSTDCNDNDASIYPNAPELCDGKDNNCNGQVDEGFRLTNYYRDADGDGYGNDAISIQACSAPVGYVDKNGDCNDNNINVHPNAIEVCDGLDNDCNGRVDERCTTSIVPNITIDDATVYESAGIVVVNVHLSQPTNQTVAVRYATSNGTAMHPKDYERVSGVLQFNPGTTQATISINIKQDNFAEVSENFFLNLSNVNNANIIDDQSVITILDPPPTMTLIDPVNGNEGAGISTSNLSIMAKPNPSNDYFSVMINGRSQEPSTVRIIDNLGRLKEVRPNIKSGETIIVGQKWQAGIYLLEVRQGSEVKTIKLIKQ